MPHPTRELCQVPAMPQTCPLKGHLPNPCRSLAEGCSQGSLAPRCSGLLPLWGRAQNRSQAPPIGVWVQVGWPPTDTAKVSPWKHPLLTVVQSLLKMTSTVGSSGSTVQWCGSSYWKIFPLAEPRCHSLQFPCDLLLPPGKKGQRRSFQRN